MSYGVRYNIQFGVINTEKCTFLTVNYFLNKRALCFRAVFGSQKNWESSTESSHITLSPHNFSHYPETGWCICYNHWAYMDTWLLPEVLSLHSVQISCSVMSDSLWPHELHHARPPCPSPTPGVHPNSCASSWWYHPAISSSVVPFSSCP